MPHFACSTPINVNRRRAVSKSTCAFASSMDLSSSEPSLCRPRRLMSIASILLRLPPLIASLVAFADEEIIPQQRAKRRHRHRDAHRLRQAVGGDGKCNAAFLCAQCDIIRAGLIFQLKMVPVQQIVDGYAPVMLQRRVMRRRTALVDGEPDDIGGLRHDDAAIKIFPAAALPITHAPAALRLRPAPRRWVRWCALRLRCNGSAMSVS